MDSNLKFHTNINKGIETDNKISTEHNKQFSDMKSDQIKTYICA